MKFPGIHGFARRFAQYGNITYYGDYREVFIVELFFVFNLTMLL